jgi:ketosteroid isomerase-like protein
VTGAGPEADKRVVTEFMAAISGGDDAGTSDRMSEDFTWWVSGDFPLSGTYDKAGFLALLEGVGKTCTGPLQVAPKTILAENGRVALEAGVSAETNEGRRYDNQNFYLCVVRDGKVAEVREYMDTMHTNATFCEA